MSEASTFIDKASAIVAAYVGHNTVHPSELPALLVNEHSALVTLSKPKQELAPVLTPAVPIKKSVTPDHLISLEDGKRYRTLKRHLGRLGMTPEQYRTKWGLPPNYPMVAATYAAMRSDFAKARGLGQARAKVAAAKAAKKSRRKRGSKAAA